MGQMRFLAPPGERISDEAWRRAYVAGMEGIPWRSHCSREGDLLVIRKEVPESGSLYVPWPVENQGELMLSTTSLMERSQPYRLALEVCRGTVNRLRNQSMEWEMGGLVLPADLHAKIRHAAGLFARAATFADSDPDQAHELIDDSLKMALRAMDQLGAEYARQVLAYRHHQSPRLPTLLAGDLGLKEPYDGESARCYEAAFNSAAVTVSWRAVEPNEGEFQWSLLDSQVDWCQQRGLRVCLGPLLVPSRDLLPDWLYLWEEDFDQLEQCVTSFLQQVVARYQGRAVLWHCAAQLNAPSALSLSEEQRLRLSVRCVEAVRHADRQTPAVISFSQPWAEYLAGESLDLSPLHFADALVRADLGLAGVGLEVALGQGPGSTEPRDILEVSQQLDRWALLGLPLLVGLSLPSGPSRDGTDPPGQFQSPELQEQLVRRLAPLIVAKHAVQALTWSQLDDSQPHQPFPCGVFDALGLPKPALAALEDLRREHLT